MSKDKDEHPLTAYQNRQILGEATLNETFSLTQENVATIIALLGKAKKEQRSPTALVMLENLSQNLSIFFDRMIKSDAAMAYIKVARTVADDRRFEYGKIVKDGRMTKALAIATFLNFLQQDGTHDEVELIYAGENDTHFEIIARVVEY